MNWMDQRNFFGFRGILQFSIDVGGLEDEEEAKEKDGRAAGGLEGWVGVGGGGMAFCVKNPIRDEVHVHVLYYSY